MAALQAPLTIGDIRLDNRVFLAPMSGVTDAPFRRLAWRFGAGLVVSEMVASEALVTGNAEMELKALSAGLPLHVVQIAGREAHWMALAARMAADNGADLIDINMGCPARRVTTGYSGSALMRDLDNAVSLIEAVVGAVGVSVSLKMRLGWDDTSINAPELARRAEDAGIVMVTVHGRTRCQFYKGKADWRAVRAVREATSLPLVVNGDIADEASALEAMRLSGADAVMIGRASYGAPWLAGEIAGNEALGDLAGTILAHYEDMLSHYGVAAGLRQARKHLGWYLDSHACATPAALKREMMTATEPAIVFDAIATVFNSPEPLRRAA
ncbi:MAG: tRNA dihydrouridine synthase DusB [Salaquimonas sp.]|nr:tRNA dihydrouridine synthase DusB [Salaquimonas sp.]